MKADEKSKLMTLRRYEKNLLLVDDSIFDVMILCISGINFVKNLFIICFDMKT